MLSHLPRGHVQHNGHSPEETKKTPFGVNVLLKIKQFYALLVSRVLKNA
jgi:hypothetical protein